MKYANGKGAGETDNKKLAQEREDTMTYRSEDFYSQVTTKSKRRKRIQDRRARDNEDFMYERPVKRPRNKTIKYYDDEGYYG